MQIDWFIVYVLAIAILFGWWSLWLTGKGKDEKRPENDVEERKDSPTH
jgi:hypothetical protein